MTKRIQLLATVTLTVIGIALSPKSQAVVPPPDGGYPGGNTAEGQNALLSLTTGTFNTAVGLFSLRSNTTGSFNTAIGAGALFSNFMADQNTATGAGALLFNESGQENTAYGAFALFSNSSAGFNTAIGAQALFSNVSGSGNTAVGDAALKSNTLGGGNTAVGDGALFFNTEGFQNTAIGSSALASNTVGFENVAVGGTALLFNTEGNFNIAIGLAALYSNTTGTANTAIGLDALYANTVGDDNTAIGFDALLRNETGIQNTGVGEEALSGNVSGTSNTAIGFGALANSTGSGSIAIGTDAGELIGSSNNVIAIGSPGDDVDNTCFIGNIRDVTTQNADAIAVVIDSAGQLGTMSSSRRYKKEIKPMDKASEAILALKPVTFHYKSKKMDRPQFGLIAEEVAEVDPDLVVCDKNGEIYSVRYDQVNAMLLNEFLKEHRSVVELKKEIAALTATVKEQAAQIREVSDQIEMSKAAANVARSHQ